MIELKLLKFLNFLYGKGLFSEETALRSFIPLGVMGTVVKEREITVRDIGMSIFIGWYWLHPTRQILIDFWTGL